MRFYDKQRPGLAFDEPTVEKTGVGTITRQEKPKQKENTADADRKADDAFMAEPSDVRGTESGAYDGVDTGNLYKGIEAETQKYRKKEEMY